MMEQHPNWMPAQLATALGRCERWARKWARRFQVVTGPSFNMYLSQSRAPKNRSRQTPEAVKDVICNLRVSLSEQYHRPAGSCLIRHYRASDTPFIVHKLRQKPCRNKSPICALERKS
jgi:hypothetical protein